MMAGARHHKHCCFFLQKRKHEEIELVLPNTTTLTFPTPHRYIDFNRRLACWPPSNDDIYLELDIATISNNEFLHMTDTVGAERWMRDGVSTWRSRSFRATITARGRRSASPVQSTHKSAGTQTPEARRNMQAASATKTGSSCPSTMVCSGL